MTQLTVVLLAEVQGE